ncbi:MAG: hypothetical protein AAF354_12290 [Pseudomonadota bacterium]
MVLPASARFLLDSLETNFMKGRMKPLLQALALVWLTAWLSGCATPFEPRPHLTAVKNNSVVSSTSSLSHTFLSNRNSPISHCAQPPPDSAFAQREDGDIAVSLIQIGGGNDAADADEQSSELELQGRTPSVLLARTLLFRLCEFARNQELSEEQAVELYRSNLDVIRAVSTTEAGRTQVNVQMATSNSSNASGGGGSIRTHPIPDAAISPPPHTSAQSLSQPKQLPVRDTSTSGDQSPTSSDVVNECADGEDNDGDGDIDSEDDDCAGGSQYESL